MRDPWRQKLDRLNARRGGGFGRNVAPIRAARQHRHEGAGPWGGKPRHRLPFAVDLTIGVVLAFSAPFALHHAGALDTRAPANPVVVRESPNVIRISDTPTPTAAPRPVARTVPICSGGNRAERRLTCVVDGDTGWENGAKWRLTSPSGGVDAPEVSKPECAAEKAAGDRATRRLQALMSGGYTMSGGDYDRYDRRLVLIILADGRDAGAVLIEEGLAQPWPNSSNPWCGF